MKRCSALGSGASTSPPQLLCRLPPRCPGPQPSIRPPPSAFWASPAPSVSAVADDSCPYQGTGVRGDRWDAGRNVELEAHTSWALTLAKNSCSHSLGFSFLLLP